jgi:hypothetical protein
LVNTVLHVIDRKILDVDVGYAKVDGTCGVGDLVVVVTREIRTELVDQRGREGVDEDEGAGGVEGFRGKVGVGTRADRAGRAVGIQLGDEGADGELVAGRGDVIQSAVPLVTAYVRRLLNLRVFKVRDSIESGARVYVGSVGSVRGCGAEGAYIDASSDDGAGKILCGVAEAGGGKNGVGPGQSNSGIFQVRRLQIRSGLNLPERA